ncbi:MAG: flagellar biosynthesis protein FliQ [Candidatus Kapabacteria bacterium]|jgi:flagellar biosynthetic protein FliQ|nr:flagellar biosynthesis protein FliQ [Candidatus Kapabacteria bacterium]
MSDQMVIAIIRDAFWHVILICGPLLLVSLVIGLVISIFQAATSISEQTLTFVPKLLAVFIVTVLIMPFIIGTLKTYTINMFKLIETMGP